MSYLKKTFSRKLKVAAMSEQMNIFDIEDRDWEKEVSSLCESLVEKHKLPKNSLYLAKNMGKSEDKKDQVTSYSICIYEPEYPEVAGVERDPSRNTVVSNIKINKYKTKDDAFEVRVGYDATEFIGLLPGAKDKGQVPKSTFRKFVFDKNQMNTILDGWLDYIDKLIEYELRNYSSKATRFACCSHFVECSDAKSCVHPNKLYACACYYKANLDAGKIFYGKNKNID